MFFFSRKLYNVLFTYGTITVNLNILASIGCQFFFCMIYETRKRKIIRLQTTEREMLGVCGAFDIVRSK